MKIFKNGNYIILEISLKGVINGSHDPIKVILHFSLDELNDFEKRYCIRTLIFNNT